MENGSAGKRIEQQIKLLCSLGVDGKLLLAPLLELLGRRFQLSYGAFLWSDEQFRLSDCYLVVRLGALDPISQFYLSAFDERWEWEVAGTLAGAVRHDQPTVTRISKRVDGDHPRHDFFNLIWRSIDADIFNCLNLTIREAGRIISVVQLTRSPGQPEFQDHDERTLERLAPYVTQALACKSDFQGPWVDSDDQGLVVLDAQGRIEHLSPSAHALMTMAANLRIAPNGDHGFAAASGIENALQQLRTNLPVSFLDRPTKNLPAFHLRNAWGRFSFRAYWLNSEAQGSSARMGILVQRQEPIALRLWRSLDNSCLSGRERSVALLIALGDSYAEIALKLSMSERTVVTHAQHIFNKLGVRNRCEVVVKLLGLFC